MGQTTRRRQPVVPSGDPFWDLVATARRLHAPGGCPWDRAQTVESLLPYLIEETWEVFESVRGRRRREVQDELGDVLYTVLFLIVIAERQGWGSLRRLLRATRQKMIRRHPHVFGNSRARTAGEAYRQWQAVKRSEEARPSRSKALRPLLVDSWEWLRREPHTARRLRQLLMRWRATQRKTSGSSRRPSARPSRRTAR